MREPGEETQHDETVIPVVEERAEIGIRRRTTGRTRVATRTETVTEDVAMRLASEAVEVTRIPVGRDLDPGEPVPGVREEGDTTILPVLEEVLVVEKRLRLVEEVRVRRTREAENVSIPVTLRRQIAEIEREDVQATDDDTYPHHQRK